jgi:hypothetical protein
MKLININLRELNGNFQIFKLKKEKNNLAGNFRLVQVPVPGWRVPCDQRKLLRQAVKEFFGQERVPKIQRENKRQCFTDAE